MTGNEYPPYNGKARKRGRRKPRPAHLPPYEPDAVKPENEARAKKQLAAAPPAAAFGARKGAANALLFHQLKKDKSPGRTERGAGDETASDDDDA